MIQFLEHQREAYRVIQSGEYREVWWYGSIRAGKTVGHGAGQTWRMIRYPGDYIIANSTAGNVWAVQWPLIHAFAQRAGVSARERGGRQPYIQVGKSKGWVVGLQSAGSHRPHMGKTTRGGWYSEVSLYNQDSFDLILGRGSARNAMHLMDSNPDGPAHWMAGYIREVEKRNGYARRVHIRENVHLDPEYISYVESIYTLPHYEQDTLMENSRLVLGLFISMCQRAIELSELDGSPLLPMLVRPELLPRSMRESNVTGLGWCLTNTSTTLDSGSRSEREPTPTP